MQSGALAIPKLAAGGLDITFGNWVSFIKAQGKVGDLRFIAESYLSTPNSGFVVYAGKDSGINSAKDLAGKKIAVNAKANINELLLRAVLDANDVDFNTVTVSEMPFPDMAAAVQNGTVDAAATIEPFVTNAQKTIGAKVVTDLTAQGPTENFPLSGFATTAKFAKENPNTVAAFQRAMAKGQKDASDRATVEPLLQEYAKVDKETASLVHFGEFPTTLDATRLQRVATLMKTYGLLEKEMDVKPMLITAGS